MGCHRHSRMGQSPSGAGFDPHERFGGCGRGFKPVELFAIILGFIVFWPIGLAILLFKVWQRKFGYEGDVFAFAQERAADLQARWREATGQSRSEGWRGPGFMRSSGNVAFDDWRESELARLEEERRKLAEAEREFAEHIEELRRARDREEFESFMRARGRSGGGTQPQN
ncbi:DUF2852 domain-containing protein [Methylosinus sp. Sm6]|uniref:DUF2852 domain-containing protein n=1 Tax=Methylosinus sp. Sm6 TaxID=2866948 RepID=UPI001C996D39|nr:DUF2852 domain-containing protein [Methylosinus sp. Sm6]MBY6240847.1 DUF2852 domain-containing protein [Methylosinus sp. Sm6]